MKYKNKNGDYVDITWYPIDQKKPLPPEYYEHMFDFGVTVGPFSLPDLILRNLQINDEQHPLPEVTRAQMDKREAKLLKILQSYRTLKVQKE